MTRPHRVTLAEVAKAAEVTPSIVSRVLNADPTLRIRPETERRIRDVVAELRYRPHPVGRTLRTARSNAIGVVLPDLTNPINGEILHGAEAAARLAGAAVLLASAEELISRDGPLRNLTGRIDGLVVQRNNLVSDETLEQLVNVGIPTVLMNTDVVGPHGSICLPDAAAARLAVEHLVGLGHERIAHLAGARATDTARRRRAGWEAGMAAAGLEPVERWVVEGGYDAAGGEQAMRRLLRDRTRPTGVVVANVTAAIGALAALRADGVDVPGELSVVGIHDVWFAAHTDPPLTTVKLPLFELATRAVEMLMAQMGGAPTEIVELEDAPVLVERASTAPPRR